MAEDSRSHAAWRGWGAAGPDGLSRDAAASTGWGGGACHAQLSPASIKGLKAGVRFPRGRSSWEGSGFGVHRDVLAEGL